MNRILLAVLSLFAQADQATIPPDGEPPVYCPAIQNIRQIPNAPPGPPMPIELVAVVKPHPRPPRVNVRPGEPATDDRDVFEADVVTALYGHSDERRIRIHWPWNFPEKPVIVGLACHLYEPKGTYELTFTVDADDQWAQQALAEARLATNVLGAKNVVIGRELPALEGHAELTHDERLRPVRVEQVLSGSGIAAGESIVVVTPNFTRRSDKKPRVRTEPMIYLLGPRDEFVRAVPARSLDGLLSAACEPQVRAALAGRDAHPIVEITAGGSTRRVREILFPGEIPDAIRLLGSASEAGVRLGAGKLRYEKAAALPLLVSDIESRLFAQSAGADDDEFRLQHQLIRLLAELEDPARRDTVRLVNAMLDRPAAERPPLNPSRFQEIRSLRWLRQEDDDETVNHSLVWLLASLPQSEVVERFGPRLVALRDGADGAWREEFQLALDTCRVEDSLEVVEARRTMDGVKPIRTATGFWHGGDYQVAFSRDGKHLATAGDGFGRVWNTADWSLAAEFKHAGNVVGAAFSEDGRSLFLLGDSPKPTVTRIRRSDGSIEPVTDTPKDEALRTLHHADRQAASADGKRRAETVGDRKPSGDVAWSVRIRSLPDLKVEAECKISNSHRYRKIQSWALSPDGRTLAVGVEHEPPRLYDADSGRPIRVGPAHQADIKYIAFDPDDGTLRSFGRDEFVCVWDPKTLNLVKRWEAPAGYGFAWGRRDGRFALYTFYGDLRKPAKILNGQTGEVVCELSLPIDRDHNNVKVHWLDHQEALAIYNAPAPAVFEQRARRFNYRTGEVMDDRKVTIHPFGEPDENGKVLWAADGGKGSVIGVLQIDPVALATTRSWDIDSKYVLRDPFRLVPDGRHCLFGGLVYDRTTLKPVGGTDLGRTAILETAVSPDGRRYAVMTGEFAYHGSGLSRWDADHSSVIRIHEIPTGKMIAAFTPTFRSARQLAFAPDGSRLAVLREDNVIELWRLP